MFYWVCQLGDGYMLKLDDNTLRKEYTGYPYPDVETTQKDEVGMLLKIIAYQTGYSDGVFKNWGNHPSNYYDSIVSFFKSIFNKVDSIEVDDIFTVNTPINFCNRVVIYSDDKFDIIKVDINDVKDIKTVFESHKTGKNTNYFIFIPKGFDFFMSPEDYITEKYDLNKSFLNVFENIVEPCAVSESVYELYIESRHSYNNNALFLLRHLALFRVNCVYNLSRFDLLTKDYCFLHLIGTITNFNNILDLDSIKNSEFDKRYLDLKHQEAGMLISPYLDKLTITEDISDFNKDTCVYSIRIPSIVGTKEFDKNNSGFQVDSYLSNTLINVRDDDWLEYDLKLKFGDYALKVFELLQEEETFMDLDRERVMDTLGVDRGSFSKALFLNNENAKSLSIMLDNCYSFINTEDYFKFNILIFILDYMSFTVDYDEIIVSIFCDYKSFFPNLKSFLKENEDLFLDAFVFTLVNKIVDGGGIEFHDNSLFDDMSYIKFKSLSAKFNQDTYEIRIHLYQD